jgi:hypothetical protein
MNKDIGITKRFSGIGTLGLGGFGGGALVEQGREVGGEVGVERDDLGDVSVDLLDERHVLHHVVRDPRLVVLVHLLDQRSVLVQHALHLTKVPFEGLPQPGVAALLTGGGG